MEASLTSHEERRVAVHACVDPRTVRRYLKRVAIHSTSRARVEAALVAMGLAHLVATERVRHAR